MGVAVSYSRVSTLRKQQRRALKEQKGQWKDIIENEGDILAECGAFYRKRGTKVASAGMYVDEGISGKDYIHREAFKAMIQDGLEGKFEKIYVEDTSRFARCSEDGMKVIKDLREKGVNVFFRKENLNSIDTRNDFFLTNLFALAENENKMKSERFKWKLNRLHQKGGWSAPAPYGYNLKGKISKLIDENESNNIEDNIEDSDEDLENYLEDDEDDGRSDDDLGVLEINDIEAPRLDYMFYLYTERLLSPEQIANEFNKRVWKTKRGKDWTETAVRRTLNNPICKGDVVNHKTETYDITRGTVKIIPEDEHIVVHKEELRIISDEMWFKKEKIREERSKKNRRRKKKGLFYKEFVFISFILQ